MRVAERLEERPVVGDEDPHAAEGRERLDEHRPRRRVGVVGRLVEQEHVRRLGQRAAELPALPLAGGEGGPAVERRGVEGEPRPEPARLAVGARGQRLDGRPGGSTACGQSATRARALAGGEAQEHPPRSRLQLAGEEAQQRRLAGAVLAGEAGPAGGQVEVGGGEDGGLVRVGEA